MVSWKDAAEMKLSVSSEALVMPSSTGGASAGLPPIFSTRCVLSLEIELVDLFAPEEARCRPVR